MAVLVSRLETSGAAPREEFGPARWIFASYPVFLGFAVLLLAWGIVACWRARPGRALSLWFTAGALLTGLAAAFPWLLLPGFLVLALACGRLILIGEDRASEMPIGRDLEELGRRLLPLGLPRILEVFILSSLLAALGGVVLALGETAYYTVRFVPELVQPAELAGLRAGLVSLGTLLGLEIGLVITITLVLLALALRVLARRGVPSRRFPLAASLVLGQGVALLLLLLLRSCVADEIDELGFTWAIAVLVLLAGGAMAVPPYRRFVRWNLRDPEGRTAEDLPDYAALLLTAALVPPARLLGRRIEAHLPRSPWTMAATLIVPAAAGFFLLGSGLYPSVEDFRGQFFDFLAGMAVFLIAGLLLAVTRVRPLQRRRAVVGGAVVLLAAGLISGRAALNRPEVELVVHEYSRMGAFTSRLAQLILIDSGDRLGAAPVPGVVFRHHGGEEPESRPHPESLAALRDQPPILIFIWDAVRPDHTSVLNYDRPTTPHLERFSRDAVVFTNAYSVGTATSHGVRCLMTGFYSTRYMLAKTHAPFFTSHLSRAGYDRFVVTVTGNDHNGVSAEAFERNWPEWPEGITFDRIDIPNVDDAGTDPPKVDRAVASLRGLLAERGVRGLRGTFTYVHLIGAHSPWPNDDPVLDLGDSPIDRYDGEIAKIDAHFGRLMAALEDMGVLDEMILVIVADHGTGLLDHGRLGGFLPYEEQIRVPLVIRVPGVPHRIVTDRVATIDLAPTLLHAVAPETGRVFHGRSLLPLMTGKCDTLPPRHIVSFCAFADAYALLEGEGRWKLWHNRRDGYEALYDLVEDPRERVNLIRKQPEVARRLRDLLGAFLWQGRSSYANPYHYRDWEGDSD
jgi:arylsulfatase A-like enzyme/MFS family permease